MFILRNMNKSSFCWMTCGILLWSLKKKKPVIVHLKLQLRGSKADQSLEGLCIFFCPVLQKAPFLILSPFLMVHPESSSTTLLAEPFLTVHMLCTEKRLCTNPVKFLLSMLSALLSNSFEPRLNRCSFPFAGPFAAIFTCFRRAQFRSSVSPKN